jgi:hypothetical protein
MDDVLFVLAGTPVTLALATGTVTVLGIFAGLVVLVTSLRAGALRSTEAARNATEALRANFVQQLAERDARLQELDRNSTDSSGANVKPGPTFWPRRLVCARAWPSRPGSMRKTSSGSKARGRR